MAEVTVNIASKVIIGCTALLAIQFVPYGHLHQDPPVIKEPHWNTPEARNLAKRACFDCHSHESIWPWYSRIAPVSWFVNYDFQAGRSELNFSDWQEGKRKSEAISKIAKEVSDGEMPPLQYRLAHTSAKLSDAEKQQLIDGLKSM